MIRIIGRRDNRTCNTLVLCLTASTAISAGMIALPTASWAQVTNYCYVTPNRADALDFPSKHAWDLFLTLNHPAIDINVERGQPNCTKPIGSPGETAVWETWRGAQEVFLPDGSEPAHWNDPSLAQERGLGIGSAPKSPQLNLFARADLSLITSFHELAYAGAETPSGSDDLDLLFPPNPANLDLLFAPDGVFGNLGAGGETRMNRPTFEFIKRNCLWNRNGLELYAQGILSGDRAEIQLPSDSIEVKAMWLDFERAAIPEERRSSYYTYTDENGKEFGLTSLHVLTKAVPNWFWATFHHVDAPANPYEDPNASNEVLGGAVWENDDYGRPAVLEGTVWANYVLGGTQIDFTTPTGAPTILSDAYIESGFERSSCINCHSAAAITPDNGIPPFPAKNGTTVSGQVLAMCILTPEVEELGITIEECKALIGAEHFVDNSLVAQRGAPLPKWFEVEGKPFFFQTDFLWSIPFRTSTRFQPGEPAELPDRCQL